MVPIKYLDKKFLDDTGSGIPNLFIFNGSFLDHLKSSSDYFFYNW